MPIIPPVLRGRTPDLPAVPPLVQYLLGTFLEPILAWLSTLVYRPLLLRCADHPLVLLAQWFDPEPPATTPQIVDTFAMASPVAPSTSVAHLLAHLTLRLARLWLAAAPAARQHALPPLDLSGLVRLPLARTASARQQRLQSVLMVVDWVVAGLTPHLPHLDPALRTTVAEYLDALAKVQADELTTDASGYRSERTATTHGVRRLASAVDRAATFRKHDGHPAVLGTNSVISTTATRIRACVALTGCTPDSAAPVAVLTQQQDAGMALPPHLIMDQAAGWGKVRAGVDMCSAGDRKSTRLNSSHRTTSYAV